MKLIKIFNNVRKINGEDKPYLLSFKPEHEEPYEMPELFEKEEEQLKPVYDPYDDEAAYVAPSLTDIIKGE